MARVVSFVYCENVQNETVPVGSGQVPKAHIIGPLSTLNPISIPGNFSFSISVGIQGFDSSDRNTFRITFVDPKGNVLNDTNLIEIPHGLPTGNLPRGAEGIQINFDVRNLILEEEGDYKTLVYFNQKLLGEYPILVVKGVR